MNKRFIIKVIPYILPTLPILVTPQPTYYSVKKQNNFTACYPANNSYRNLSDSLFAYFPYYKNREDPLAELIKSYKESCPSKTIEQIQALLGVKIYGEPTQHDLEDITSIYFKEKIARPQLPDLKTIGIKNIIIIPPSEENKIDYKGLAELITGEMLLISGQIKSTGIFVHELTHFEMYHRLQLEPNLLKEWEQIAGSYNHVILEPKRGVISVKSYTNGTIGAKYGYVQEYGGKDSTEDIATYTQFIATDSEVFSILTDSFSIYREKLKFLKDKKLISPQQYEKNIAKVNTAQQEYSHPTGKSDFSWLLNSPSRGFSTQEIWQRPYFCAEGKTSPLAPENPLGELYYLDTSLKFCQTITQPTVQQD